MTSFIGNYKRLLDAKAKAQNVERPGISSTFLLDRNKAPEPQRPAFLGKTMEHLIKTADSGTMNFQSLPSNVFGEARRLAKSRLDHLVRFMYM